MAATDQDTHADSPNSLPHILKRRSLWGRKPQQRGDSSGSKGAGGVTVTPHTGLLPRITTPLPSSPSADPHQTTQQLAIPGIPAQGGREVSDRSDSASIRAAAAAANALKARAAAHERNSIGESHSFTLQQLDAQTDTAVSDAPHTVIGIGSTVTNLRGHHHPHLLATSGDQLITTSATLEPQDPAPVDKKSAILDRKAVLRRLVEIGWIPQQRGVWTVLTIPLIVGIGLSHFDWRQVILFFLWITGYFAFNASTLWLRLHRQERYWPPVRAYGLATILIGAITIVIAPELLEWAAVLTPLLLIGVYQAIRNHGQGIVAQSATVAASCAMLPVAYDLGTGFQRSANLVGWLHRFNSSGVTNAPPVAPTAAAYGWGWVLIVSLSLLAYFWSTLLFARTISPTRYSTEIFIFSVTVHMLLLIGAVFAYAQSLLTLWNVLVWFLLAIRSCFLPLYLQRSRHPLTRVQIERLELIVMALFILSIFA